MTPSIARSWTSSISTRPSGPVTGRIAVNGDSTTPRDVFTVASNRWSLNRKIPWRWSSSRPIARMGSEIGARSVRGRAVR